MDHVLPRELEHAVFTIRDHLHINFSAGFKKQRKKSASYKYVSDCIRKKMKETSLMQNHAMNAGRYLSFS